MEEVDVAIVGAGLAGLSAADRLVEQGRSVVVLEARDRVGGRVLNHTLAGHDAVVELGAEWIGPTQDRMYELAQRFRIDTFPTWTEGESVVLVGGARNAHRGAYPPIGRLALADVGQAQARLERMARRVPLERPWEARHAERWDSMTVETWLRRNTATPTARSLLHVIIGAVWAAEPADLSLLHLLFYIRSGGSLDMLLATRRGAQQDRFVGGSQLVPLRLAEHLGDRVRTSAPVRTIVQRGDTVELVTDSGRFSARRAIVAVAPALAARIAYEPPMPAARDQLTQRVAMGSVVKAHAVYDEPFWRSDGLSGSATADTGSVRVTFDNSPPSGSPGVLLAFVEGRQARELSRLDADQRRKVIVDDLTRMFGPKAAAPVDYAEQDWAAEEWSRGCYAGYFPPGTWIQFGTALREPVGPVHWAGTETATEWNGYMEGAVRSGYRAASEVLAELSR